MAGKTVQKVAGKTSQNRFGRTPDSVLFDKDLSASARCIYAYLARSVFQGSVARFGQRRIAKDLGFNRETVGTALHELQKRGHLSIVGEDKERRTYVLHSHIFGQKQRTGQYESAVGPSGGARIVSLPRSR